MSIGKVPRISRYFLLFINPSSDCFQNAQKGKILKQSSENNFVEIINIHNFFYERCS